MSWLATETLTAHLPDPGGLRAAAYNLRHAGDILGTQAAATRGVAAAIGPGLWQDEASGRAKAILGQLDTELSTGSSAMHQAADVLDNLAGYVSGQQGRYEETGRLLEGLARDPIGTIAHHELAEAEQLIEERRSIEQGVSAAMGHASDVINQAASRATRYHGGQSFWSSLEHDAVKSAKSVWHTDSEFARGVWDGTYGLVKGTAETAWSLTVLGAKLSPARMLVDPAGWKHDMEHALNTGWTSADYIAHHKKQFIETLLNLKDLKSDPAHWFGELAPLIASIVITKGAASFAAEGADSTEVVSSLPGKAIDHFTDGVINEKGKPTGFHSAPDGIPPAGRRIDVVISVNSNGTYVAKVSFQLPDGTWASKNVNVHTMFPDSWSKPEVVRAVDEAFKNKTVIGSKWFGQYNGVKIEGYVDSNGDPITAFPAKAQ